MSLVLYCYKRPLLLDSVSVDVRVSASAVCLFSVFSQYRLFVVGNKSFYRRIFDTSVKIECLGPIGSISENLAVFLH